MRAQKMIHFTCPDGDVMTPNPKENGEVMTPNPKENNKAL